MPDDMQAPDPSQIMAGMSAQMPNVGQASPQMPTLAPQQTQQAATPPSPRPILLDLIKGLIHPQAQNLAANRPTSRTDVLEGFLGNFMQALGSGFANEGRGPGAALRGAGAAMGAPYQQSVERFGIQQQAQEQQAQIQQQQAQTQQIKSQGEMVQTPLGPMSLSLAKVILPQYLKGGAAAQTSADSKENIAGDTNTIKEKIAELAAQSSQDKQATELRAKWDMQTRTLKNLQQIQGLKGLQSGAKQNQQLTSSTRTMIEMAPTVKNRIANIRGLLDDPEVQGKLGPAGSRFSEFMAGSMGVADPKFTKLRSEAMLLQTALMRMHVGARGSKDMMEHFRSIVDTGKQSPANMKAALDVIDQYADEKIQEGRQGTTAPQAPAGSKGNKVLDPLGIR